MKKPPPKKVIGYIEPTVFKKLSVTRVLKRFPREQLEKLKASGLINLLLSSLSLSSLSKFRVIANIPVMSKRQHGELMKSFCYENSNFKNLLKIKNERIEIFRLFAINLIRIKELLFLLDEVNLNEDMVFKKFIGEILTLTFNQYPVLYDEMNACRLTSDKIEYVLNCYECYALAKGDPRAFLEQFNEAF